MRSNSSPPSPFTPVRLGAEGQVSKQLEMSALLPGSFALDGAPTAAAQDGTETDDFSRYRALFGQLSWHLESRGGETLDALSGSELTTSWNRVIDAVTDSKSSLWRTGEGLAARVAAEVGLSEQTLFASLGALATGLVADGGTFAPLPAASAETIHRVPAFTVLAGNVPGLILQVLGPALAKRRPMVFKVSSRLTPLDGAILNALLSEIPALADAYAAFVWEQDETEGAQRPLSFERALCEARTRDGGWAFDPLLVYGGAQTQEHYRRLVGDKDRVVGFGPRVSAALIVEDSSAPDTPSWLDGLARDIALFDQRGCLSVRSVLYVGPQSARRARQLAEALARLATELPPARISTSAQGSASGTDLSLSSVRQWVDALHMAGSLVHGDLARGGVVAEQSEFDFAPGGRSVTWIRCSTLQQALERLAPVANDLQGVAVDGNVALAGDGLATLLARRAPGVRVTRAGSLQRTDWAWRNGGIDLLDLF